MATKMAIVISMGVFAACAASAISEHKTLVRSGDGVKRASIEEHGRMALVQEQQTGEAHNTHSVSHRWVNGQGQFGDTLGRDFVGASPVVSQTPCTEDAYTSSALEQQWSQDVNTWTADHCNHMKKTDAQSWINGNTVGPFDPNIFSTVCRKGKLPQFIEPLAGIMRDPRVGCYDDWKKLMSVDWLVFPSSQALGAGAKARFYDAGGSRFTDAMQFFLKTYSQHGIVFDEVYAWEAQKQGYENYWTGVAPETRAFWEPRLTFYDGTKVSAEKDSENNPVARIFKSCAPEDFCAMKLDIDTPSVELPLVQQFLNTPDETKAKLDEFFFEHHVHGVMQRNWKQKVAGTFADSYKIFGDLRKLGVRAHSWV